MTPVDKSLPSPPDVLIATDDEDDVLDTSLSTADLDVALSPSVTLQTTSSRSAAQKTTSSSSTDQPTTSGPSADQRTTSISSEFKKPVSSSKGKKHVSSGTPVAKSSSGSPESSLTGSSSQSTKGTARVDKEAEKMDEVFASMEEDMSKIEQSSVGEAGTTNALFQSFVMKSTKGNLNFYS